MLDIFGVNYMFMQFVSRVLLWLFFLTFILSKTSYLQSSLYIISYLKFIIIAEAEEDLWEEVQPPDPGSEEEENEDNVAEDMSSSLNNDINYDVVEEDIKEETKKPEEISVATAGSPRLESGPVGGNDDTVGYCAPYTGNICRKHLNGSGHVYYNFTSENHPIPINEQITIELWSELVSSLLEPCRWVL